MDAKIQSLATKYLGPLLDTPPTPYLRFLFAPYLRKKIRSPTTNHELSGGLKRQLVSGCVVASFWLASLRQHSSARW